MATGSQLTFHKGLGYYTRSTRLNAVILYGAEGSEVECKIMKKIVDGQRSTKFGTEWQLLCRLNGYKEGDVLRFTFVNMARTNLIKVWKI